MIETLSGSLEKRALLWLAARMPAWVTPDVMTMLGLGASVLIFASYALTGLNSAFLWLASLGYVLHWFGDSLDGTLARYRKIERPRYGFFVDHIIDSVSEAMIFLGLGFSPYLRFDLALLALSSYLLLATYVYLATYVNGVFRISYARLGPTEARILAILANAVVFFSGDIIIRLPAARGLPTQLTIYDCVAIGFILITVTMFVINTLTTAMALSREDRLAAQAARRELRIRRKATRRSTALRPVEQQTISPLEAPRPPGDPDD